MESCELHLSLLKRARRSGVSAFRSEPGDGPLSNSTIVKRGNWAGRPVELFRRDNEYVLFTEKCGDKMLLTARFDNLERLEKYFTLMFGKIEWPSG